jgi:drug/metabolite transporter (DMT)-like permease
LSPLTRTIRTRAARPDAAPAPLGGDSVVRAVLYMLIAAGLIFPLLNASVKYLGQRYPMPEIFWVRYAGHVVYSLIAFLPGRGRWLFATRRPGVQVMRAVLLFGASAFYFLGLLTVDLPTASAIAFVSPIIVTALARPVLGERIGPRRWTAVMLGFLGALVIIRPGSNVVQWGAILILLDALCYSIYQVLSRKVGSHDPAEASITLAGIGGLVLASLLLPFSTIRLPQNSTDLALFLGIGLWGLLGHYFVTKALQWGTASIVAPIGYGELVGSTLFGWLLFHGFPDLWTWIGAAIIVGSGLYITYREHRLRRIGRLVRPEDPR